MLILASASPRRAELLRAAGFHSFAVRAADLDESLLPGEAPREYVLRLSSEKARAVARPGEIVLAADTTVVIGEEIAAKPIDAADAGRMLRALSGAWHEVLTGVSIIHGERLLSQVEATHVKFMDLSEAEIDWYVASGEPMDKAGAYGIQGLASRFVERIEGSYSNVVGLPMQTVYRMLRELGA